MINKIIASILLVLFSPVMLIIALLIKVTSRGQIIYKQKRAGLNGKIFTFYKFRTMVQDADKNGVFLCKKGEKKITGVGRILRSIYLDELPQLFNIIKGDMNFIGPRPEMLPYHEKFKKIKNWNKRLKIKPGITGLAQISNVGSFNPKKKLEHDLLYIKNKSLLFDAKIILKTGVKFFQHLFQL